MGDSLEVQERSSKDGRTWKYLPVSLDPCNYAEDFRTKLLTLVRPEWEPAKLQYTVFDEGITNMLIGFFQEGKKKEDVVLLRVNGNGTEKMIDREAEVSAMLALNSAGMLPPLYLQTDNGLCYGFAQGRYISLDEMADETMMKRIARKMARLHAVPIPASLRGRQPQLWAKCDTWLKLAPREFDDPKKNEV